MREWLFGKLEIVAKVVEFKPEIDPNGNHASEEWESVDRTGKKEMVKSKVVIPNNYRVDVFANGAKIATLASWGKEKGVKVPEYALYEIEPRRLEAAEQFLKQLKPIETQR